MKYLTRSYVLWLLEFQPLQSHVSSTDVKEKRDGLPADVVPAGIDVAGAVYEREPDGLAFTRVDQGRAVDRAAPR